MSVVRYTGLPFVARFRWSTGKLMETFYKAFAEKRILAVKCERCGYTATPPRIVCPKCNSRISEKNIVELDSEGIVQSFTVVRMKLDGKGSFVKLENPEIIAAVKLNGTDSTIFVKIGEVKPENMRVGMKVKAVWAEKLGGKPSDLLYFKPG